jgi:hypothetical protein
VKEFIDLAVWSFFLVSLVIVVIQLGLKIPGLFDVDITDPLSILDEDEEVKIYCEVCGQEKEKAEHTNLCVDNSCVLKQDDTH